MINTRVILRPRKALPFLSRHPWVRQSAIDRIEGDAVDGGDVDLVSDKGTFVARGLYNSNSRIRVRLYTWRPSEFIDEELFRRRLRDAIELRRQLGYLDLPEGAARLVFSEGDFLSGLIVDRFAESLVVQVNSLGIAQRLQAILPILRELAPCRTIAIRVDEATRRQEGVTTKEWDTADAQLPEIVFITEHGLRYGVETSVGQKTGFYLDQRENRRHVAKYLFHRRVLDICCYTGGFSLAASALGQATQVLGIDSSDRAVALAKANAKLNSINNVQFFTADMFSALESQGQAGERYGAVILDPPKFVRNRAGVSQALRAYHRLNRLAIELLEPGGILATCSCSGNVSRQQFVDMLFGVATKVGRDIQILEQHGAAPDHPVAITCPETEYLKCIICRVV
jgi:23S rRNA (cytosine1962-C5)-methyltransferase